MSFFVGCQKLRCSLTFEFVDLILANDFFCYICHSLCTNHETWYSTNTSIKHNKNVDIQYILNSSDCNDSTSITMSLVVKRRYQIYPNSSDCNDSTSITMSLAVKRRYQIYPNSSDCNDSTSITMSLAVKQ